MSRRNLGIGLGLLVGATVVLGLIANRPPNIPAGAAATSLDRTSTNAGHGQRCLDRVKLGAGWADVCWSVDQDPNGDNNTQDDYELRVYGSFQGLKWLVVRADLVGRPNGGAYRSWPTYLIEGSCRQVSVHLLPMLGAEPIETVCGRTEGELDIGGWTQTLTWTCELCLLPDAATKPLSTYAYVAVDQGTVPEWDVFVDGGS